MGASFGANGTNRRKERAGPQEEGFCREKTTWGCERRGRSARLQGFRSRETIPFARFWYQTHNGYDGLVF